MCKISRVAIETELIWRKSSLSVSCSHTIFQIQSPFISMAVVMASSVAVSLIDYDNKLLKHAAWILHAGLMGAFIGPVCLMAGPLAIRAAWYTAAIVAGNFFFFFFVKVYGLC